VGKESKSQAPVVSRNAKHCTNTVAYSATFFTQQHGWQLGCCISYRSPLYLYYLENTSIIKYTKIHESHAW